MAPVSYIAVNVGQLPCNGSDVIIIRFLNTTTAWQENKKEHYDSDGAMKFIVTTLMVYSLMGISGLLLMRIRRRASRTHRVVTIKEEDLQQYIKQAEDLKLAGHRHKLKMDATRMVRHLQNLERQRSYIRSDSEENNVINESAAFLYPEVLNRKQLQHTDSQNGNANKPILASRELHALPPLPEEQTNSTSQAQLTSMPIVDLNFRKYCSAIVRTASSGHCQAQFEWEKLSPHSSTCNKNITTGNDKRHCSKEKYGSKKHVTFTAL